VFCFISRTYVNEGSDPRLPKKGLAVGSNPRDEGSNSRFEKITPTASSNSRRGVDVGSNLRRGTYSRRNTCTLVMAVNFTSLHNLAQIASECR